MGTYIIVHIVQTEKVEWFPNAYYRITLNSDEPMASKIVFPQQPPNFFPSSDSEQDFVVYPFPPKDKEEQQESPPFLPHHPNYPASIEGNDSKPDEGDRSVYFRRNGNSETHVVTEKLKGFYYSYINLCVWFYSGVVYLPCCLIDYCQLYSVHC